MLITYKTSNVNMRLYAEASGDAVDLFSFLNWSLLIEMFRTSPIIGNNYRKINKHDLGKK